jgi:Txe/YoeB family toxin of toxin-antitoxin system
VVKWRVVFTAQAQRDAKKAAGAGLRERVEELLTLLREEPLRTPPRFERLAGDLKGAYSRRINIQHRLVYQVLEEERVVKVLRMWTHYE